MKNLERLGYVAYAPLEIKTYRAPLAHKSGRKRRLMPGYVFFAAETTTTPDWTSIKQIKDVLRILQYDDGERAFRNEDFSFAKWLLVNRGIIDISRVMQIGTMIRVIDGPLKFYEGRIVEVKKHRQSVAIDIGAGGHFRKIWCPIEYVTTA